MKICNSCKTSKDLSAFSVDNSKKDKLSVYCRSCLSSRRKRLYWDDPDQYRNAQNKRALNRRKLSPKKNYRWESHVLKRYGLTINKWNYILESQNELCAICRISKPEVVDHDHQTDIIRGLLCHKCNRGLGHFNDDQSILNNAVNYLRNAEEINHYFDQDKND